MIISKCSQNSDGTLNFELQMQQEEADYLISFAVNTLVSTGAISINPTTEETQVDLFADVEGGMQ